MTKEQEEKLGEYLGEQKINVVGWYLKGKKNDVRIVEIDGCVNRDQLNKISEIIGISDIQVSMIVGQKQEDILAVCWIEK